MRWRFKQWRGCAVVLYAAKSEQPRHNGAATTHNVSYPGARARTHCRTNHRRRPSSFLFSFAFLTLRLFFLFFVSYRSYIFVYLFINVSVYIYPPVHRLGLQVSLHLCVAAPRGDGVAPQRSNTTKHEIQNESKAKYSPKRDSKAALVPWCRGAGGCQHTPRRRRSGNARPTPQTMRVTSSTTHALVFPPCCTPSVRRLSCGPPHRASLPPLSL